MGGSGLPEPTGPYETPEMLTRQEFIMQRGDPPDGEGNSGYAEKYPGQYDSYVANYGLNRRIAGMENLMKRMQQDGYFGGQSGAPTLAEVLAANQNAYAPFSTPSNLGPGAPAQAPSSYGFVPGFGQAATMPQMPQMQQPMMAPQQQAQQALVSQIQPQGPQPQSPMMSQSPNIAPTQAPPATNTPVFSQPGFGPSQPATGGISGAFANNNTGYYGNMGGAYGNQLQQPKPNVAPFSQFNSGGGSQSGGSGGGA